MPESHDRREFVVRLTEVYADDESDEVYWGVVAGHGADQHAFRFRISRERCAILAGQLGAALGNTVDAGSTAGGTLRAPRLRRPSVVADAFAPCLVDLGILGESYVLSHALRLHDRWSPAGYSPPGLVARAPALLLLVAVEARHSTEHWMLHYGLPQHAWVRSRRPGEQDAETILQLAAQRVPADVRDLHEGRPVAHVDTAHVLMLVGADENAGERAD